MSCIYYKFKASKEFDTIRFDGLHITLTDVKDAITVQKKLGRGVPNTVLQIINAQTGEEYTSEDQNIPKNTSVIVSRVPIGSLSGNLSPMTDQASQSPKSMDGVQKSAASVQQLMEAPDMSRMEASEEDKIRAMMHLSVKQYDTSNYQRKPYFGAAPFRPQGKPHTGYICHRCGQPGHFIHDCPLKGTEVDRLYHEAKLKRSTGIPNSFLRLVNNPMGKAGVMRNDQGGYVINAMDAAAFIEGKIEKPPFVPDNTPPVVQEEKNIPVELLCDMCKDILEDAVVVPCCGHSFCDDCIRSALLQTEDHQCPHCHETDVSPDKLISNAFLRRAVNSFQNDTGYSKAGRKPDPPAVVCTMPPPVVAPPVHFSSTGVQLQPGSVPAGAHTYIIQPGQALPPGMVLVSQASVVSAAPAQVVANAAPAPTTGQPVLVAPNFAGATSSVQQTPGVTHVPHTAVPTGAVVAPPHRPGAPIHLGAPALHGAPVAYVGQQAVRMPHPVAVAPGAPHIGVHGVPGSAPQEPYTMVAGLTAAPPSYGAPVAPSVAGQRPLTEEEFYTTQLLIHKRSHTDQMIDDFAKQLADINRKSAETTKQRSRTRSPYRSKDKSRSPYPPRRRSHSRSPYRGRRSISPRRRSYSRSPSRISQSRYRYRSRSPGAYRRRSPSPQYRSRSPSYRAGYPGRGRRYGAQYDRLPYQGPPAAVYPYDPRYSRRDMGPQPYTEYVPINTGQEYPPLPPVPGTELIPPLASPKKTRKEKREKKDQNKSSKKRRKVELTVEEEADEIIRQAEAEDMGIVPPEEEPSPPGVDSPEKPASLNVVGSDVNTETNIEKTRKSSSKSELDKDGKKRHRKRPKTDKSAAADINKATDHKSDSIVEVSSSTDKPDVTTTATVDKSKSDTSLADNTKSEPEAKESKLLKVGKRASRKAGTVNKSVPRSGSGSGSGLLGKVKTEVVDNADDSVKLKLVKRTKTRRVIKTETTETHETMTHEEEEPETQTSKNETITDKRLKSTADKPLKSTADKPLKSTTDKPLKSTTDKKVTVKKSSARVKKPKVKTETTDTVKAGITDAVVQKAEEKNKIEVDEKPITEESEKVVKKAVKKVEKRRESVGGEVLDLLADDNDLDDLLGRTDNKLMADVPKLSKWERERSLSEDEFPQPKPQNKVVKSSMPRHVRESAENYIRHKPRTVLHSKVVTTSHRSPTNPSSSPSPSPDRDRDRVRERDMDRDRQRKVSKYKRSHMDDVRYKPSSDYSSRRHQDEYRYRDLDDNTADDDYRQTSSRHSRLRDHDRSHSRHHDDVTSRHRDVKPSRREERDVDDGSRYVESSAHDIKVTVQEPQSHDDLRYKIRRAREEKQRDEGQRVIVMKPNDRRSIKTEVILDTTTSSDSQSSSSDSESESKHRHKKSKHKKHKHHKKHKKHKKHKHRKERD